MYNGGDQPAGGGDGRGRFLSEQFPPARDMRSYTSEINTKTPTPPNEVQRTAKVGVTPRVKAGKWTWGPHVRRHRAHLCS